LSPFNVTPFSIDVPQQALEDLRARLQRTRFPDEVNDADWGWGMARSPTCEPSITAKLCTSCT
jgi:hypothetical protein